MFSWILNCSYLLLCSLLFQHTLDLQGSGKTLAFAIPLIQRILEIREYESSKADLGKGKNDDEDDNDDDDEEEEEPDQDGSEMDLPPDEEEMLYAWKVSIRYIYVFFAILGGHFSALNYSKDYRYERSYI